jgi:hypothetical protein
MIRVMSESKSDFPRDIVDEWKQAFRSIPEVYKAVEERALRFLALGLVLLLAGCSDPETSRLTSGAKAVVVDRDQYNGGATDKVLIRGFGQSFGEFVEYGTHVTVEDDFGDKPVSDPFRNVKVKVEDGVHAGYVGTVSRHDIRPY